jgi:high-affinity Fe2+/Pb2+ permease
MLSTIASTALVLVREGFESVLLTGMIAAALPGQYRNHINFNFIATWVLTLIAGWFVLDAVWPWIEHIENIFKIVTALVLIYIFFNSRAIFLHAKEHADEVKDSGIWTIHLTVFLIVLREALESTVFLGSNIKTDPWGVLEGFLLGIPLLCSLLYVMAFSKSAVRFINTAMFRYVGFALLALAAYYLSTGILELLEIFGIDIF